MQSFRSKLENIFTFELEIELVDANEGKRIIEGGIAIDELLYIGQSWTTE